MSIQDCPTMSNSDCPGGVDVAGTSPAPADEACISSRLRKRPAPSQTNQPCLKHQLRDPKNTRPTKAPVPLVVLPCKHSQQKVLKVERGLAFGPERLPVHSKTSQTQTESRSKAEPALDCLPALDPGLRMLLQDVQRYSRSRKYNDAILCLHRALQLTSEGRLLQDMMSADPEDISLVLSYIHSRLVECYYRTRRPQRALEHAHRSIQLNPSHFQNHLRQAVVYRTLDRPWLAAKSALTADWLHCASPGTEPRTGSQLRLYWQVMLNEAHAADSSVAVAYSPFSGDPSTEEILRTEQALTERDPSVTWVYTDPRALHVLPQTTHWLCPAPLEQQRYYISLGFKFKQDGLLIEKLCSRMWPALAEARGDRRMPAELRGHQSKPLDMLQLKEMYEKMLPVLDLMQATQISSGVSPGSGLMEWLQYSSLLEKLGLHRERTGILQRCQAQLSTVPFLPPTSSSSSPQPDEALLQQLQADLLDELGGGGRGSLRVWDEVLQVGWLEDLIRSVERSYYHKKAIYRQRQEKNRNKKRKACKELFAGCDKADEPLPTISQSALSSQSADHQQETIDNKPSDS